MSEAAEQSVIPRRPGLALSAMLLVVVAFRPEVFFGTLSLAGLSYGGSDESSSYQLFVAGLGVIGVFFGLRYVFRSEKLRTFHLLVAAMPIILVLLWLFDDAMGRTTGQSSEILRNSLIFAPPAAAAGMAVSRPEVLARLGLALEPLMLLMTVVTAGAAMRGVASNEIELGGASYQSLSYVAAFAFCINLYFLLFGRLHLRWRISQSFIARLISVSLLPVQIVAILLSGGRGGLVLALVGALLIIVLRTREKASSLLKTVLVAAVMAWLFWEFVLPWIKGTERGQRSLIRVLAYIGDDGIDWSGTSGRDDVYATSLESISDMGLFGYGLFNWGPLMAYPHNIILEFLIHGGVFYLAGWAVILLLTFKRFRLLSKQEPDFLMLLPVALYPLIMLQFSGTYLYSGSFWFVITAILAPSVQRGIPISQSDVTPSRGSLTKSASYTPDDVDERKAN